MYVPNYVPEPIAMPGNVTQQRYAVRLLFIRETLYRFGLSTLIVALLGYLVPVTYVQSPRLILAWLALIGAISLTRSIGREKPWEAKLARIQIVLCVVSTAVAARCASANHFPAWSILAGLGCFCLYAMVCGRDFSFVGGYVLALIVSSTIIAFIMLEEGLTSVFSQKAIFWNASGLFYLVYDLASLLSRRKVGEETAATVDLYRDMFNLFGWVPRVIMHWYRHRILNDLSFDLPFRRWIED